MKNDADDDALMLEVKRGNMQPLAALFSRHHVALYNFFRKLGHPRGNSEDLVQETFIRILNYAGSFDDGGAFVPWLYRIARNAANDAFKAMRAHEGDEALAVLQMPEHEEPDAMHAAGEFQRRFRQALQKLPREKRELILLSRVKQLGTEDLARLYDCSSGAIKVRLHRSLAELQEHLDQNEETSGTRACRPRR